MPTKTSEPNARREMRGRAVAAGTISAMSIKEFCAGHDISQAHYFNLQRAGQGPRTMRVGGRVLISLEAAADWRRAMEARTATVPADGGRA